MRARPAFLSITVLSFLAGTAMQLIVSTLPLYLVSLGMPAAAAGWMMGGYTLASLFARPAGGWLCDRIGRRPVLLFGSGLYALSSFGFLFFKNIWMIAALRILQGAGYSALTTAAGAIAADLLPKEHLSEGIGRYGAAKSFSLAAAPAIGLFLLERHGGGSLFIAVLAASLASAVIAVFQKDECEKKLRDGPPHEKNEGITGILEASALRASLIQGLLTCASASVSVFLPTFFASRGIGYSGLFLSAAAAGMIASRLLLGSLLDRVGVRLSVLPACALLCASYLLVLFSRGAVMHCLAALLFGTGQGMSMPALNALALKNAPPERHGKASGTYYASLDLGLGLGAVAYGILSAACGFGAVYAVSSALCVAAGVLTALPRTKSGHAGRGPDIKFRGV